MTSRSHILGLFTLKESIFIFLRPVAQFQKCMSLESCELLKLNAYIDIKCCGDEMCNTF